MVAAVPGRAVTVLRLLAVVVALLLPAAAAADPQPLRPAPAQTVPAGTLELEFVLRDDPSTYQPPVVEVSDSPELDEEGHFREEPVEVIGTEPADATGVFSGRAEGAWLAQPGTYWWRAYGETCVPDPGTDDESCEEVATPPQRLEVVAPVLGLVLSGEAPQPVSAGRPIGVAARCDEACTVTLDGALWRRSGRGSVRLDDVPLTTVELELDAARSGRASWRLARQHVATVRRAQAAGATVVLVVTASAEAAETVARAERTFEAPLAAGAVRRLRVKAAGRVRPRSLPAGRGNRLIRLQWRTWGGATASGTGLLRRPDGRSSAVRVRLSARRTCRAARRYGVVRWRPAGGAWSRAALPGRCR